MSIVNEKKTFLSTSPQSVVVFQNMHMDLKIIAWYVLTWHYVTVHYEVSDNLMSPQWFAKKAYHKSKVVYLNEIPVQKMQKAMFSITNRNIFSRDTAMMEKYEWENGLKLVQFRWSSVNLLTGPSVQEGPRSLPVVQDFRTGKTSSWTSDRTYLVV